jgi:hypothetical protein
VAIPLPRAAAAAVADAAEISGQLLVEQRLDGRAGRVWKLVEILERRSPSMVISA